MLDQPDYPISELADILEQTAKLPPDQRKARLRALLAAKTKSHTRVYLGRDYAHSVALRLEDANGLDRLIVMVKPDGTPVLQFLDEKGNVVSQLPQK
jgi:hypothetical protein